LHQHLHQLGPRRAGDFIRTQANLIQQLAEVSALLGSDHYPLISDHKDELLVHDQSYGDHAKPEDYLDSFNTFIRDQLNQSVALAVVVNLRAT